MNKQILTALSAVLLTTSLTAISAKAEDEAPNYQDTLTGDWGDYRTKLYNEGINIEGSYKVDGWSNTSGGLKRHGSVLDNLLISATLDGEKLYGVKGSSVFVSFINNNGGKPGAEHVGNVQGVDNIEVPARTAKIFEAWVEQNFMDDQFSLRAGLYDLNTEFYYTESAGLFLNPTFGMTTELAQTGQNGPSVFPTASVGLRAKWQPNDKYYLQAVVLDGVPGDPNNPQGTHVQFNNGDGALIVAETGYSFDFAKVSVGGWTYTEKFDDLTEIDANGNPIKRHDYGVYGQIEKEIAENITGFVRAGTANGDINQTSFGWDTGIVFSKIVPGREDSQLGFAISGTHNSDKYKTVAAPADYNETGFELTYSDQLTPWLRIQPDIQYTANPGTDPSLDDSLLVGLRLEVDL
ncbi:MAG: porin [Rickettsiaceae bacterium]|nr:porin [Rickettsiaceae bacterium]